MVAAMDAPDHPTPPETPHRELVVLTGDLVGSSRLGSSDLDTAIDALRRAAEEIMRHRGAAEARFTRFRGDSWQCVGPSPERALRAALTMRASLRALGRTHDTRISIGIGPGHLPPETGLAGAGGVAFELSGQGLDGMGAAARFALAWADPPRGADLLRVIFALADEISRRWTPRQAQVFAAALLPGTRPNQEALAEVFGIRQQVVARHLAAGGDWALRRALEAVERDR